MTHLLVPAVVRPMSEAPKDGSTILLQYRPLLYWGGKYHPTGTKWEECRWVSDQGKTGSEPHWEPWCGASRVRSSNHINEENCLGWMEVSK